MALFPPGRFCIGAPLNNQSIYLLPCLRIFLYERVNIIPIFSIFIEFLNENWSLDITNIFTDMANPLSISIVAVIDPYYTNCFF